MTACSQGLHRRQAAVQGERVVSVAVQHQRAVGAQCTHGAAVVVPYGTPAGKYAGRVCAWVVIAQDIA